MYLFSMDVLFDLEHRIWSRGAAGLMELAINIVTVTASIGLGWWIWHTRNVWDAHGAGESVGVVPDR